MPSEEFPALTAANHRVASPRTPTYNCFAWAAGDTTRWWEPDAYFAYYWPRKVQRTLTMESLRAAYGEHRFVPCADGSLEPAQEKLAIYVLHGRPTHAARQLPDGTWTSKLGTDHDIVHDTLEALSGPAYGTPVAFLSRPRGTGAGPSGPR